MCTDSHCITVWVLVGNTGYYADFDDIIIETMTYRRLGNHLQHMLGLARQRADISKLIKLNAYTRKSHYG